MQLKPDSTVAPDRRPGMAIYSNSKVFHHNTLIAAEAKAAEVSADIESRYSQISLGQSVRKGSFAVADQTDEGILQKDMEAMQQSLLHSSCAWPEYTYKKGSPFPILMNKIQMDRVEALHNLLAKAITNIVERWWSDVAAKFPQRMPLTPCEEDILQWMDEQTPGVIRPFRLCQGSWRPDFLIEGSASHEEYRICEINARFPFNAYLYTAFSQKALIDMDRPFNPMTAPVVEPQRISEALMSLFDPSRPLHLLKGDEAGFDFNMFAPFVESITEKRPRLIHVSDLRLLPCKSSATGFALYCTSRPGRSGVENLERIYQVGLELRQDELRSLSAPILRELSRCCFNDLRSIFLVHDKRMLGIVLQELEDLVSVRRIMTVNEADTLRRGIALTIVPGSRTIHALTKMSGIWPGLKDEFVLKPIRSGKGAGILFGDELSYDEWLNHLVELKRPDLGDPESIPRRNLYGGEWSLFGDRNMEGKSASSLYSKLRRSMALLGAASSELAEYAQPHSMIDSCFLSGIQGRL
ncbi:MAG: hypothetical protein L6R41_005649 [Letrouitia leprolyta]|nr:MAG: hypothetical protein L6R41_005649 [Letrouitia leprolyta]